MRTFGRALTRGAMVAVVASWVAVVVPTSAAAATLAMQPATDVGIRSATLHGSGSGWGAGDYCSFAYGQFGPTFFASPQYAAWPCNTGGAVTVRGLNAATSYTFFTVHCADTEVIAVGTVCKPTFAAPEGYDQVAQCTPNFPAGPECPRFTTGTPALATTPPTLVRGTSAQLNATVGNRDLVAGSGSTSGDIQYRFEYSTDPNFTGSTISDPVNLTDGLPANATTPVSFTPTNLSPGTTYYYRVQARVFEAQLLDYVSSETRSFKTGGFVATQAATGVTGTAATLNGQVATGDAPLTWSWRWSRNADMGNATTIAGGTVPAGEDRLVETRLSGLPTAATIYVQLVTTTPGINGEVVQFTTLPANCATGQTYRTDERLGTTGFVVAGCWSTNGATFTGHGPVIVNGIAFSGASSLTVTIDSTARRIRASKGYSINLGTVALYPSSFDALDVPYTQDGDASVYRLPQVNTAAKLFSLTIGGTTTVRSAAVGGATVTITALGMPVVFNGLTAEATVRVRQDTSLGGVRTQLGYSTIGAITMPGVIFEYDADENLWIGDANLVLPLAGQGIQATLQIKSGQLNGLGAAVEGLNLPLGASGMVITSINFSTVFRPLTFQGGIGADVGPKISGTSVLGIGAGFYAGFDQDQTLNGYPGVADGTVLRDVPFTLGVNGNLTMLGVIQLAEADLKLVGVPGWPFVGMRATLGQPIVTSCGGLGGSFGIDPSIRLGATFRRTQFNIYGNGGVTLLVCALPDTELRATAVLSSRGMAICGNLAGTSVGLGGRWPANLDNLAGSFDFYPTGGCNVGPYYDPIDFSRDKGRTGDATAPSHVRLPAGLPFAVLKVQGVDGPPRLRVTGPGGRTIEMQTITDYTMRDGRHLVIPDARNRTTYVNVVAPAAGTWRVEALPGSAKIRSLTVANGEPDSRVRGSITASGSQRVVRWNARAIAGQQLVIREVGSGGERELARTTRASGTLRYVPTPGVVGQRSVLVDVYRHGLLDSTVRIGRFAGPTIRRPGAVSRVTMVRRGPRVIVAWRASQPRAHRYRVDVTTADGRRRLSVVARPRVVLLQRARGVVRVRVTGVDSLGRRGPTIVFAARR